MHRSALIIGIAAVITGCEGDFDHEPVATELSMPGISDTCVLEGEAPSHLDGVLNEGGADLFVFSVDAAVDGEPVEVIVDRERDTVLILASATPVRWNVSSSAHVRVITIEGDHAAVEQAVVDANLPLAGFHGCRRSGSFGLYD